MELHCHNVFSNNMNGSPRVPFDCGVTVEDQLLLADEKKIDVIFITNHNTLNGYKQMLEYKENHEKFKNIKIYPAEEITINTKGHVLAYGIHETIKPGMDIDETLDTIRKQNAVSCAAHPFAVSNGIRENAIKCDMIESFNSNNIDNYSNITAEKFSSDNKMISIAGSDSHVRSTFGRCINTIESENNLDSILQEMLKRKSKILKAELAFKEELFEHAHYILSASKDQLLNYVLLHHPSKYSLVKWALDSFISKPNSKLWKILGSLGLYLSKRVSNKVNMKGYNPYVFEDRSWKTLISMSLYP
ncbi:MAG TPA: PHP-associated domain-containing protein [Nitrososphaeraceae archaeon]|jgi:predicted metal-dependent phosphoesterase TrpH|nr:PHP-associated domain-containing protein [Nitrososphaeraceae archaeon]